MEGSHGRAGGAVVGGRVALPFVFGAFWGGGLVGVEGFKDVILEFLLSLSGPWRALFAKMGTSSLRGRLRDCGIAELAEMTLTVRFKLLSVIGPFVDLGISLLMAISAIDLGVSLLMAISAIDLGVSLLMAISAPGLGSAVRDRGR